MTAGLASTLLSLAVIAALALGAGGVWLIVRRRDIKKGVLMLVAALVLFGNVAVWTV